MNLEVRTKCTFYYSVAIFSAFFAVLQLLGLVADRPLIWF